jgi:Cu+-exporting ATPase
MKFDPVCGTAISPEAAISTARYRGETYYFCSVKCKLAFDHDPRAYLKEPPHPRDASPSGRHFLDSASTSQAEAH